MSRMVGSTGGHVPARLEMSRTEPPDLERRVARAAAASLARARVVTAADVLVGLGWLAPSHVEHWRQGPVASLEELAPVDAARLLEAVVLLRRLAEGEGLVPVEAAYVARSPDRRPLRFTLDAPAGVEEAFGVQWMSPTLSERERERLAERQRRPSELVVIAPLGEWACARCTGTGDQLIMGRAGRSAWRAPASATWCTWRGATPC